MFTSINELIFVLVTALAIGIILPFWSWMLRECMTKEPPRSRRRIVWIALFLVGGPLGAALYFFIGRRARVVRGTVPQ